MTQTDTHCQRKDTQSHVIDAELDLLLNAIREMYELGKTGWFQNPAVRAEKDYRRAMAYVTVAAARVEKQMQVAP